MTAADEQDQLALADRLDAQGRHGEAIDVLARAARSGLTAAKSRIGARILVGDRAPLLGPQGAGLIEEAAREGDSEAAARMAVLCAAGVFRKADWRAGLDWLLAAACGGLGRARAELAVLAGDEASPDGNGAPTDPAALAELRARIDLQTLFDPPEGEALSADPVVTGFPGFASPAVCAWMIARSGDRLKRAEIYNPVDRRHEARDERTNTAAGFTLLDTDLVFTAVQERIARASGRPFHALEGPSVLHYWPGEQFRDHFDFIDPRLPDHDQQVARNGQRVATFLVYLNEDYEGGETDFPRLKLRHHGRAGDGLLFVNALADGKGDVRMLHAGRSPESGEKWVFSQFIRSRSVLPDAEGGAFLSVG